MVAPLRFLNPQAAQLLNMLEQLRAFERVSPEEQQQLQYQQLHALLLHAWSFSPFWKHRLTQAGFEPNQRNDSVLTRITPLSRKDLQTTPDDLRARWTGMSTDRLTMATTSGSTGTPVRVERYTDIYSPLFNAINRLDDLWHNRDPEQKLCVIGAGLKDRQVESWGNTYLAFGLRGAALTRALGDRSIESHLDWLLEHRPRYLKCSPFLAASLARLALDLGVDLPVEHIISQSERVTPQQRAICRQAFGARIVDRYSCEEIGWIALQCPEHDHLHVMTPGVLVEIVDEQGNPCAPGQVGRVLLTSLHSYAMPIIRYEVGDLAEWGEPCSCGNTMPVLKRLWGRTRHQLALPDGSQIPMPFLGDDIGTIASILEFQVAQYQDRSLEIQVKTRDARQLSAQERTQLKRIFSDNGLGSLALKISEVAEINWGPGWKREEFVRK